MLHVALALGVSTAGQGVPSPPIHGAIMTPEAMVAPAGQGLLPVTQQPAGDAYLDPQARDLVHSARDRRQALDRSISAYQVLAQERSSRRLLSGRRDWASVSRRAWSIHWRADGPVRVEVLPPDGDASSPPDARTVVLSPINKIVFDPATTHLLLPNLSPVPVRDPLGPDGDEHYRFATGDSAAVVLPTGGSVRLRELRVLPRRADPELIVGSLWLELDSYVPVRAVYRLATAWTAENLAGGRGLFFFPGIDEDLDYFLVDYALWDGRWWLPHRVRAGSSLGAGFVPHRLANEYELLFSGYVVEGDVAAPECRLPYRIHLGEAGRRGAGAGGRVGPGPGAPPVRPAARRLPAPGRGRTRQPRFHLRQLAERAAVRPRRRRLLPYPRPRTHGPTGRQPTAVE